MIVTVQAVPERMKRVNEYLKPMFINSDYRVNCDFGKTGCLNSFYDMLNNYTDYDYRLHLQDDVILADSIEFYLPTLQKMMQDNCIDVLSLFGVRKPSYDKAFKLGLKYTEIKNFYGLQACIFSPRFQQMMRKNIGLKPKTNKFDYDEMDDLFVGWVAKKNKIKVQLHLPVLATHDIKVESTYTNHGYTKSKRYVSNLFDENYINKYYAEKLQ